ncbi:hypothetical protein PG994_006433 [Apiospora phragmitis]|uniref:Uncharacterized protein n=1 Tax=Apiospora phragmitis TaxID=2905665 RepID=A0ABR1VG03_9PEZI
MDFPEWAELAPCAASAVSYNVILLAPCVCNKNQNSLRVSQAINTSPKSSCSAHTADVSSAQALFAAYCGLNNGASSFPAPPNPPGDIRTYDLCPPEPKALASFACIKDGMPGPVSAVITSSANYSSDKTASADISSALSVWDIYCSAAKGLTAPAGITESVEQTTPVARTGSANGGGSGPQPTGSNGAAAGSGKGAKSNVTVIAGAVVGVVLGLGAIGAVLFYFMWRRRHAQGGNQEEVTQNLTTAPDNGSGKPELDSTALAVMPALLLVQAITYHPSRNCRQRRCVPQYPKRMGKHFMKPLVSSREKAT